MCSLTISKSDFLARAVRRNVASVEASKRLGSSARVVIDVRHRDSDDTVTCRTTTPSGTGVHLQGVRHVFTTFSQGRSHTATVHSLDPSGEARLAEGVNGGWKLTPWPGGQLLRVVERTRRSYVIGPPRGSTRTRRPTLIEPLSPCRREDKDEAGFSTALDKSSDSGHHRRP
jgi:hypothetical protein